MKVQTVTWMGVGAIVACFSLVAYALVVDPVIPAASVAAQMSTAAPTTAPTYKGRYKSQLPGAQIGTSTPEPLGDNEKDGTPRVIVEADPSITAVELPDPPVIVTTVAPKPTTVTPKPTTTVPVPTTTVAPKPTTMAPEPEPVPVLSDKCTNIGVQPNVEAACSRVLAAVTGIPLVGGVGQRPGNPTSCHPGGLALDFMVYSNKALGDRVYAYVKANKDALGATDVILWQVPDHYDHVHVSFKPCRG